VRFAHSWLVNKIIALSVSLHLLYMVKHKVLLDKQRSIVRCSFSLWAPVKLQMAVHSRVGELDSRRSC